MSALAPVFAPAPLRYRDVELTALSFAGEVRYHDRTGALAFRITPAETERLARVSETSGRAALMMFLFFKIVARPGLVMTLEAIASEVGGVTERDVGRAVSRLVLGGLVRKTARGVGFEIEWV